eukprot:Ihof_evm5s38 gene=Ihof_evmTU5s38
MASIIKYEGAKNLRQRIVLSVLSGRPVRIDKIRNEENDPGLRDYEVSFIRLMDKLTNGSAVEINHSGTSILFKPGILSCKRKLEHDCGSTRAIGYFLEPIVALAPFSKHPTHITFTGITNDSVDPTVDSIRTVTLPLLKKFGIDADEGLELKIVKRGAPPLGGGEVLFRSPTIKKTHPVNLTDAGKIKRVRGIVYSTRMSPQTGSRVVESARGLLNRLLPDVYIYTDHYKGTESGLSPGYALVLVAETTNGTLYGSELCATKGSLPEDIGRDCSKMLFEEIHRGGCVDTQNQALALLFMVLGPEDVSKVRLGKLSPY